MFWMNRKNTKLGTSTKVASTLIAAALMTAAGSTPASADPTRPALADGGASSGGGHGIVMKDGKIVFADQVSNPETLGQTPIDLFRDPETAEAAAGVMTLLHGVQARYPKFGADLIATFKEMTWTMSDYPLKRVNDDELNMLADPLVQLAAQNEDAHVAIDKKLFAQIDDPQTSTQIKEFMITHELVLAKLGLKTPRKAVVRPLVEAFLSGRPDYVDQVAQILNGLDSHILRGEFGISGTVEDKCDDSLLFANGHILFTTHVSGSGSFKARGARMKLPLVFRALAGYDCDLPAHASIWVNGVKRIELDSSFDKDPAKADLFIR
jgi:hypothetical protein